MKKTKVFVILACMTCIFYTSCEKTGYQVNKTEILDDTRILPRGINIIEDCEECPVDYCCCGIELDNEEEGLLEFCGVYSPGTPTTPCGEANPPSPCSAISGSIKTFDLDAMHSRELFCAPIGSSFSITNIDDHDIDIWFTCQPELTNPDFEAITIAMGDTRYFRVNGSCNLEECEE